MDKDYFGRSLRYVFVDEQFVNELMVKKGFAKIEIIEPNVKYSRLIQNAEDLAMKENGCIWK
jgi:endonuclease YncB( thermonuclease family)